MYVSNNIECNQTIHSGMFVKKKQDTCTIVVITYGRTADSLGAG